MIRLAAFLIVGLFIVGSTKAAQPDSNLAERVKDLATHRFALNLKPLPPGSKPRGGIEQWSGFSRGIMRPALMHITPNVVRSQAGQYMFHQDTPRIVREVRRDLIDDRPRQR
jgi:hypothetical protein